MKSPMRSRETPPDSGFIAVGEITAPYGIRGAVWVKPFAARSARRNKLGKVILVRNGESSPAEVTSFKPVGERWIVALAGIQSREDAGGLRGWVISIPIQDIASLPEDTHFVHDMIGRKVLAEDGRFLGRLANVFPTGTNDVYAIEGPEGELLFPALRELVIECPRGGDTMRVRIPPGLMESCLTRRN